MQRYTNIESTGLHDDVPPLILEVSSVPTNWRGAVWECPTSFVTLTNQKPALIMEPSEATASFNGCALLVLFT